MLLRIFGSFLDLRDKLEDVYLKICILILAEKIIRASLEAAG